MQTSFTESGTLTDITADIVVELLGVPQASDIVGDLTVNSGSFIITCLNVGRIENLWSETILE